MMRVLVIPDVHLKPWMFEQAAVLMREKKADRAVCLMDIPDDWEKNMTLHCTNKPMMRPLILPKNFRRPPGVMAIMT